MSSIPLYALFRYRGVSKTRKLEDDLGGEYVILFNSIKPFNLGIFVFKRTHIYLKSKEIVSLFFSETSCTLYIIYVFPIQENLTTIDNWQTISF